MKSVLIHRGNTYKTKSNRRVRKVTPSKKVVNVRVGKKGAMHRCHDCNQKITSIIQMRTAKFSRQKVSKRRVSRPLGATHCSKCVAKKITVDFFNNETRAVNK
ncbi:ribosomal prt L34 [Enterospora canceri]|uniref:Ribosomal prt L34 n=1 Tax=Enterospora canceri TaxID=1081671 RepID=A0A1Y1S905_9MICR|nr:ribosomal prt L34 [Enterospora canceri]